MNTETYKSFVIDDHYFCTEQEQVEEIVPITRITPIPLLPDYIAGVAIHNEKPLIVVDLEKKLGLHTDRPKTDQKILITRYENLPVGFLIDREGESIDSSKSSRQLIPFRSKLFTEAILDLNKVLLYLNIHEVLEADHLRKSDIHRETHSFSGKVQIFQTGGILFCSPSSEIFDIVSEQPLVRIPLLPEYIPGIFLHGNEAVILFEIAGKLQMVESDSAEKKKIIITRHSGTLIGFIVDSVQEETEIVPNALSPVAYQNELIQTVYMHGDNTILFLDLKNIARKESDINFTLKEELFLEKTITDYRTIRAGLLPFLFAENKIQEIMELPPITRIPFMPEYVAGITNYQNHAIPAIRVAKKLHINEESGNVQKIALASYQGSFVALLIDEADSDPVSIDKTIPLPPLRIAGLFPALALNGQIPILILNTETLFRFEPPKVSSEADQITKTDYSYNFTATAPKSKTDSDSPIATVTPGNESEQTGRGEEKPGEKEAAEWSIKIDDTEETIEISTAPSLQTPSKKEEPQGKIQDLHAAATSTLPKTDFFLTILAKKILNRIKNLHFTLPTFSVSSKPRQIDEETYETAKKRVKISALIALLLLMLFVGGIFFQKNRSKISEFFQIGPEVENLKKSALNLFEKSKKESKENAPEESKEKAPEESKEKATHEKITSEKNNGTKEVKKKEVATPPKRDTTINEIVEPNKNTGIKLQAPAPEQRQTQTQVAPPKASTKSKTRSPPVGKRYVMGSYTFVVERKIDSGRVQLPGPVLFKHRVKEGDTLQKIYFSYLKKPAPRSDFSYLNDIENPNLLSPGDIVYITRSK